MGQVDWEPALSANIDSVMLKQINKQTKQEPDSTIKEVFLVSAISLLLSNVTWRPGRVMWKDGGVCEGRMALTAIGLMKQGRRRGGGQLEMK